MAATKQNAMSAAARTTADDLGVPSASLGTAERVCMLMVLMVPCAGASVDQSRTWTRVSARVADRHNSGDF